MAQPLTIHQATVKFPAGKTFTTQYGDRINALLVLDDGQEIKLWGNPGDSTLMPLKKGQRVAVAQGDKGWRLLNTPLSEDSHPEAGNVASDMPSGTLRDRKTINYTPMSAEEKKAVATYIDQMADLYRFCIKQTLEKNLAGTEQNPADADDRIRAVATTLFIQATRKFNL